MAGVGAVTHSIISGIFAASAGVAGKLAFDATLITKGCVTFHSILHSSEALSWLGRSQFLPSFLQHTDVCDYQVGIRSVLDGYFENVMILGIVFRGTRKCSNIIKSIIQNFLY